MSGAVERTTLDTVEFRSACTNGECVEVAITEVEAAVRDGKSGPCGPILQFTHTEWSEFVSAVKAGKFDIA